MNRDLDERRLAVNALLGRPVLDRHRHPELFALVRHPRHRPVLTEWFANRLGYRLVVGDRAARLYRLPVAGRTVAPGPYQPPPRRVLVLAILAAAAAEDAEEVTTTQDLSDRVRALTRHSEVEVEPYDPDRFAERRLFVQALGLLADAGPLRPLGRDTDERREGWADAGRRDVLWWSGKRRCSSSRLFKPCRDRALTSTFTAPLPPGPRAGREPFPQ